MKPNFRAKEYTHFLNSIKGTKTSLPFITNASLIIKYFVGTCMSSKKIVLKKSVYNRKYYHLFSFWKVFIGNFCNLNEFIEHFFLNFLLANLICYKMIRSMLKNMTKAFAFFHLRFTTMQNFKWIKYFLQ